MESIAELAYKTGLLKDITGVWFNTRGHTTVSCDEQDLVLVRRLSSPQAWAFSNEVFRYGFSYISDCRIEVDVPDWSLTQATRETIERYIEIEEWEYWADTVKEAIARLAIA